MITLPTADMFEHGLSWHGTVSFSCPTHGAISRLSFIFMEHFRFLDLIPSPHITEQLEKALHSPQIPPKNVLSTVKLGYNELGYNELPVITNRIFPLFGLGCFTIHSSRL